MIERRAGLSRASSQRDWGPVAEDWHAPDGPSGTARQRMLFLAPQPIHEDRGTPLAVGHVLQALSELGWQVDLLTYPCGSDIALPGLRVERVGRWLGLRRIPIGLSWRKLILDLLLTGALARRLRGRRYACIHAVEEAAFPAALLGRMAGVPVLYDMHSSLPEQLSRHRLLRARPAHVVLRGLERWLLRRVDRVVCSAGLREIVQEVDPQKSCESWRFPGQPVDVAPERVARLRAELELPSNARAVVYCGSFEAYQGLTQLVAGMAHVWHADPDVVLLLVGARRPEDFHLPAGRPEVDPRRLRILPRRPRGEIDAFLAMADVLVTTRSYGSNTPLKVFDYLAAGRPIVAVDCAAHRAVLDDGSALLVPGSPAGLAAAIMLVLRDPALARDLGARARARALREFGWQAFIEQVARLHPSAVPSVAGPVTPHASPVGQRSATG